MHPRKRSAFRAAVIAAFAVAASACAPAPLYRTNPATATMTPAQALSEAQQRKGQQVVWGGTVVAVENLRDSTVIQVLAYPLDSSQRPRLKQPPTGRFLVEVPGFVEPLDYPADAPVTIAGTLDGTRHDKVGQAEYDFPLVRSTSLHRWTREEMAEGRSNFRFGVGVGAGSW